MGLIRLSIDRVHVKCLLYMPPLHASTVLKVYTTVCHLVYSFLLAFDEPEQ